MTYLIKKRNLKNSSEKSFYRRVPLDLTLERPPPPEALADITFDNTPQDFSFKGSDKILAEPIDNPNIIDSSDHTLKNNKISLLDKIDDIEDPIYNLDDSTSSLSDRNSLKNSLDLQKVLRATRKTTAYNNAKTRNFKR